ncbi:3-keto-5-aminohexanoate cleavage protein [soil metagenome]
MLPKMIIMARVNERMYRTKNPHIPYTPDEIAQAAVDCKNAGASVIHFHARGPNGEQVFDPEVYMETVEKVRSKTGLLVDSSLGQNLIKGNEARSRHIVEMGKNPNARADMAAIDVGSTNLDFYDREKKDFRTKDNTYVNNTETLIFLGKTMKANGVKPHLTCWNLTFLRWVDSLMDMGVFAEPAFIQLAFSGNGHQGSHPCNTEGALAYYYQLPKRKVHWTVVSMATSLLPAAVIAMEKGGHLSPGIGDYEYPELGYPSNGKLVEFYANLARAYGREIATPEETREMLGLPKA